MPISTTPEERTRSARLVRNLALSLSGGAVLTVLGAGTALAQDSGTASDGAGAAHSGDATSVGNRSGTDTQQTGTASGTLGGLQVTGQTAAVANVGVGVSDTGSNTAVGNESESTAELEQLGSGGFGGAVNTGAAANGSNGTAMVSTGDASAVGNQSSTTLTQTAGGTVGGILLVSQSGAVLNTGVALAQTGGNDATGNTSSNSVGVLQEANTNAGLATNNGKARNDSDGLATIATGGANAVGNTSDSKVLQSSQGAAGGDDDGLLLLPQLAFVVNGGVATASTGENIAIGNESDSLRTGFEQLAAVGDDTPLDGPLGLASNSIDLSSSSDGNASIRTGDAEAVGNDADTEVTQTSDPTGLVIEPQLAVVANAGLGQASTGGNTAIGNSSENQVQGAQAALVGQENIGVTQVLAAGVVASSSADLSNASDGSADIDTGDAHASGNESRTSLSQDANGSIDGLGIVLNPQVGLVANVGVGTATTGANRATGNDSENSVAFEQTAQLASDNGLGPPGTGDTTFVTGLGVASNTATGSNWSDGSASIATGDASATGNHSDTDLSQEAEGHIVGAGFVLNTQAGLVVNLGVANANTGDNDAVGNTSVNGAFAGQLAEQGSGNLADTTLTVLGIATASNSLTAETASDGDATVRTGDATAVGNTSTSDLTQAESGHAPGLVLNTQVGSVLNVGIATADTGQNFATGNGSDSGTPGAGEGAVGTGARLGQSAQILSRNNDAGPPELLVIGPSTAADQGSVSVGSDGSAVITTGDAQARGNVSDTVLDQDPDSVVEGLGLVLGTQLGGVANVGVAVADTGDNVADGNVALNTNRASQLARVGSFNADTTDFAIVGPTTASNSADVGIDADGTATVTTGSATATGNASSTHLTQRQTGTVRAMGVVIGTQVGGVANVGGALANTGGNTATGNESLTTIVDFDDIDAGASQFAGVNSDDGTGLLNPDPAETTLLGGATASNSMSATNSSDGEACICTGDAIASGNISTTTMVQDLDLSTGSGLVLFTETGGVLNAGLGVANTGINDATGNSSENLIDASQVASAADALLEPIDGPQAVANSLDLGNSSDGAGHVGSGNATATGNLSTTVFAQEAVVDSDLAISAITGGTANAGLGLANSGLSSATGNDSDSSVVLEQTADGSGLVSNQGEAFNDSDGTAVVGDPTCCGDDVPGEEPPGLPRTGGPLEVEAAVGLLLLLAGFGLRRRSTQLA